MLGHFNLHLIEVGALKRFNAEGMQKKIFLRSNSAWSESYSGHVTTNLVWFLPSAPEG